MHRRGLGRGEAGRALLVTSVLVLAVCATGCGGGTAPSVSGEVGGSWSRVPDDEAGFDAGAAEGVELHAVVAGGPGYVAVGMVGHLWDPMGTNVAGVWTSSDGRAWTRVPDDEVFGGTGTTVMTAVTAGGPGLVAVGFELQGGNLGDAAVWISDDGLSWSRITDQQTALGGPNDERLWAVTSGGPGLVAVGYERPAEVYDESLAAVWVSPDGRSWSRISDDTGAFSVAEGQMMSDVTAGGPGLVAVGSVETTASAVWTSPDGLVWNAVQDPEALSEPGAPPMGRVATGGPGLIATGAMCSSGPDDEPCTWTGGVWTSPDGTDWTRRTADEVGGEAPMMNDLVTVGSSVIAVGSAPPESGQAVGFRSVGAAWTSSDGIAWQRVPDDEVFRGADRVELRSVAASEAGLVAVGALITVPDDGPWSSTAAVWTSP
jgi:hypothetical protein